MHTDGPHHVTAVASDPRERLRFCTEPLGPRLVERTVDFGGTATYHLQYGTRTGEPGTALTCFPVEKARPGRPGGGQTAATSLPRIGVDSGAPASEGSINPPADGGRDE